MKKPPGEGTGGFSGKSSVAQRRATANQPRTPTVPCELKFDNRSGADMLDGEREGYIEFCQGESARSAGEEIDL
jgi:hypothetical protein